MKAAVLYEVRKPLRIEEIEVPEVSDAARRRTPILIPSTLLRTGFPRRGGRKNFRTKP